MVLYSSASPLVYICKIPPRSDKLKRSKNKDIWSERRWTMAHISQIHGDCSTISCLQRHGTFCSKRLSRKGRADVWKGQKHCLTVLISFYSSAFPHRLRARSNDVTMAEEVTSCRLFLYGLNYVTLLCPERHGRLPGFSCHVQQGKAQWSAHVLEIQVTVISADAKMACSPSLCSSHSFSRQIIMYI